jgi:hypothetical protein
VPHPHHRQHECDDQVGEHLPRTERLEVRGDDPPVAVTDEGGGAERAEECEGEDEQQSRHGVESDEEVRAMSAPS